MAAVLTEQQVQVQLSAAKTALTDLTYVTKF